MGESIVVAHIEPGEYSLRYKSHRLDRDGFKGSAKLIIEFEIVGGEQDSRTVFRYYNVDLTSFQSGGKTYTRWKAKRNGSLLREFIMLFEGYLENPEKIELHSLPIQKYFSSFLVIGQLDLVRKDHKGRAISKLIQQPVVRELIQVKEDDVSALPSSSLPSPSLPSSSQSIPSSPHLVGEAESLEKAGVSSESDYKEGYSRRYSTEEQAVHLANAAFLDDLA